MSLLLDVAEMRMNPAAAHMAMKVLSARYCQELSAAKWEIFRVRHALLKSVEGKWKMARFESERIG